MTPGTFAYQGKCYITLWQGEYLVWVNFPDQEDFAPGTRLYEVPDSFTILEFTAWIGRGYPDTYRSLKKIEW